MQQGKWIFRLTGLILVLGVLFYMGYQITDSLSHPLVTETAAAYTLEDTLTATGYLIRDESLIGTASGTVSLEAGEGKVIGTGQTLAAVYDDPQAVQIKQELQTIDDRISLLEDAAATSQSTGIDILDDKIAADILRLNDMTCSQDFLLLPELSRQLKSLVFQREITYGDSQQISSALEELASRRTELTQSANLSSTKIAAPFPGTFSSQIDGYELLLTPDILDTLTVSALEELDVRRDNSLKDENLGKLVRGDTWYYAVIMDTEEAGLLHVGASVALRFSISYDDDIAMQVLSVGEDAEGKTVVVFSCDRYLAEIIHLRRQSADIIYRTFSGIKIPGKALRMQNGVTGVYCLIGLQAQFKPVSVIYTAETYYLAEYDRIDPDALRPGDEMIVAARDLFDGKVVK